MLRWLRVNFHFLRFSSIPFHFDFWTEQHRVQRKFSITHELCVCLHSNRNKCTKKNNQRRTIFVKVTRQKNEREARKRSESGGGEGCVYDVGYIERWRANEFVWRERKNASFRTGGAQYLCVSYWIKLNWIYNNVCTGWCERMRLPFVCLLLELLLLLLFSMLFRTSSMSESVGYRWHCLVLLFLTFFHAYLLFSFLLFCLFQFSYNFSTIFKSFSTSLSRFVCTFIAVQFMLVPFFRFRCVCVCVEGTSLLNNFPILCSPYFVVFIFRAMLTIKYAQ